MARPRLTAGGARARQGQHSPPSDPTPKHAAHAATLPQAAKMETNTLLVVTAAFGAHTRIALDHPFGPVPTACPLHN